MDRRLVEHFRLQAGACRELGSPFYATLIDQLADDLERGGPVADVVAHFEDNPHDAALCLRLVGTVHRHVLTGRAQELAAHYPSAGGDGDAHAAATKFQTYLTENLEEVRKGLESAPQTNEVGRSAALFGTLLRIEPLLPVRLFEVGASAGLNLLGDHYRYQAEDGWWGSDDSPVVLRDAWNRLPSEIRPEIVERRGVDLSPVDVSTDEGAATLMGYVWPDQQDRIDRLRSAISVARTEPVRVDRGSTSDLLSQLDLVDWTLTVVWHSVMWQYVASDEQEQAGAELERLIGLSTETQPFVRIGFEPYRPEPNAPLIFSAFSEDRDGLHRHGEGAPHGIPTRWY